MSKPWMAATIAALTLTLASIGTAHAVANAEPLDIDPEILSKLAKERAKTNTIAKRSATTRSSNGPDQADADCGAVAIGNVTTGRIGFQPQEVTVIVTGDVINANNRCR